MNADEWVEVAVLQSTKEEADTRFLLRALHAARTVSNAVIVTAEDTDGMLLCLAFQEDIHCTIIRSLGPRTAHDSSTSANRPGHWQTASVTS